MSKENNRVFFIDRNPFLVPEIFASNQEIAREFYEGGLGEMPLYTYAFVE
ncbi:hypothetical protein LEP1GSC017_0808 [Leptospira meyeri serovar Hardjo str. Went 5]|nr:hypothetical protein LEP1GSC017_0808 [Leptospira meyeri serovar Hardjo str. Went 5]